MHLDLLVVAADATNGADNDATTQFIIAVLSAGGLGAIIAAIVTGLFSKKKLGAEATEIITKAASGVVERIEAELARERKSRESERADANRRLERMERDHTARVDEWRRVLQLHVSWDAMAAAEIEKCGGSIPPAPPLTPPIQGPLS